MTGSVLVLNAGSSSLKCALFEAGDMRLILRGAVTEIDASPHLLAHGSDGTVLADESWRAGTQDVFALALHSVLALAEKQCVQGEPFAVGHRIVFGGADHFQPERISPNVLRTLDALMVFDPVHMPRNLASVHIIAKDHPDTLQVACFDTAFHRTLPEVARSFALPRAVTQSGVRRYGYHGLSYEYIARHLTQAEPALAAGRVIVAHLGSGASLCALSAGTSIETTFGFSVLDGLMMATRCGSIDPGAIFHLGRQGMSLGDIEDMLSNRSGLLGVSGISGDIRILLDSNDDRAREAIELFTYRIAMHLGALVSVLGGLDALVFTAGIGENSPPIREAICARLAWLGVRLDAAANLADASCISAFDSAIDVRVIPTDEERMIALHTRELLSASGR